MAMNPENIPETRAAKRFRSFFEERGKQEGLVEGKREGLAEGLAEGKREGLAEGKRETLLHLFAARRLAVSEPQRVKIRACTDPGQLDAWIVRAATASTAEDVLGEES
jgi:flagellar biosynthesis/type III secretory pathway protein FliH